MFREWNSKGLDSCFLALDFLWNFALHLDMWILPFGPPVSHRVTLLAAELLPTSFGFSCFAMVCCTLTVSTCPTTDSCLITIGLLCGLNMCTGIVVVFAASTTVGANRQPYPPGRLGCISTSKCLSSSALTCLSLSRYASHNNLLHGRNFNTLSYCGPSYSGWLYQF